ncbi:origin recognition complex subunit 2 [Irpex rosettiformis]|uniref:Origin recognition complex subunit 2 n=1 Tax=Irpex rosettiformis TaxID=378272 RepID=A0ACB8TXL3_9APHY|nr:origin recognition complex subunit 2 [Irpex rosettiformis]
MTLPTKSQTHTFAHTAFDAYFALNHKPSRTSNNVFSNLLTPLTTKEYSTSLASSQNLRSSQVPWLGSSSRNQLFPRLLFELDQGFNLLFYGAGSKRDILNTLATCLNEEDNDVIVVNAFNPSFTVKDLLASVENFFDTQSCPMTTGSGIEGQTRRILKLFDSPDTDLDLFLVIHNIDAPSMRNIRAKSALMALASHSRIHILASVDNIAFADLWSLSEIFNRKPTCFSSASISASTITPSPGYAWLFHDLTTLAPYDFETAYADRSSISGASQATKSSRARQDIPVAGASATMSTMTEDAARHILLSVTQKAKKLFVLLGTKQLEAIGDLEPSKIDAKAIAFDYSMLFNAARDDFVATNDTALRALMGEFKDHGLMVSMMQATTGAEAVWIPMRKEGLVKIVDDVRKEFEGM